MTDFGRQDHGGIASVLRLCAAVGLVICAILFPHSPRAEVAEPKAAEVADDILNAFLKPISEAQLPFVGEQPMFPEESIFLDDVGTQVVVVSYEKLPFHSLTALINEEDLVTCSATAEATLQAPRILIDKIERKRAMKYSTGLAPPPLIGDLQGWVGGYESVLDGTRDETVTLRQRFMSNSETGIIDLVALRFPEGCKPVSEEMGSE